MLIVIFEVGIVIGAYVKRDNMKDYVYKRLNYTMTNYDDKQVYREAWNLLQNEVLTTNKQHNRKNVILNNIFNL